VRGQVVIDSITGQNYINCETEREADTSIRMRPYVICHMIMSLDGRIASSRWKLSTEGRVEYEATAATYHANAWMCGRITMAAFAHGTAPASGLDTRSIPKTDYIAPHSPPSYAVAIDPSGKLYWTSSDIGGDHIITVLTEKVSSAYLAHLQSRQISYLFAGRDRIDLPMVLEKLATRFEIKTLILEGGGKINGTMLRAGLIDELSLLVAPIADGASRTPALFDTPDSVASDGASVRWKLHTMERRADDIVWLRYRQST
jgi:2,5-diamino-6-(ribosylamino)-4(3H)-pyrimidinone 5'-phosphate reductase